jgi:hypothetical protein
MQNGEYSSITLRGPAQEAVLTAVRELRQAAFVSPTRDGVTVVYPEDETPEGAALWLAARLSRKLGCAAWQVTASEETLTWALFEAGDWTDTYDAAPGVRTGEELPPAGGDAQRLCRALRAPEDAAAEVAPMLRAAPLDEDFGFLHGGERHAEIADALGLPLLDYATGFRALDHGHTAAPGTPPVGEMTLLRPVPPLALLRFDLVRPLSDVDTEDLLEWLYGDATGTRGEPMGNPLGTPDTLRDAIVAALPEVDATHPTWLTTSGDGFALDFALGPGDTARDHVTVLLSAEPRAAAAARERLVALGRATGWAALDPQRGVLLTPS